MDLFDMIVIFIAILLVTLIPWLAWQLRIKILYRKMLKRQEREKKEIEYDLEEDFGEYDTNIPTMSLSDHIDSNTTPFESVSVSISGIMFQDFPPRVTAEEGIVLVENPDGTVRAEFAQPEQLEEFNGSRSRLDIVE